MPEERGVTRGAKGKRVKKPIPGPEQLEHAACCRIIMRMADLGPGFRRPDHLPRFFEKVRFACPPADGRRLEGILRLEDGYDTCAERAFVYANEIRRGTPVLWPVLAFSAERSSRRLKVRAAFFYEAINDSDEPDSFALGWRLEPPEDEDGSHSYYHAQPISAWDTSGTRNLPIIGSLNESYPAFPILAADSVSLLAAALVAMYGRVETRNILSDPQIRESLQPVRKKVERWL